MKKNILSRVGFKSALMISFLILFGFGLFQNINVSFGAKVTGECYPESAPGANDGFCMGMTWTPSVDAWHSDQSSRNFRADPAITPTPTAAEMQEYGLYSNDCTTGINYGDKCPNMVCYSYKRNARICSYSPINKFDNLPPVCGTWNGTGPNFALSGSTDAPASGNSGASGIYTAGGTCTASAGGTCTVMIEDVAGNKTPCTSPTYVAPVCSGEIPTNSNLCPGDDTGLTAPGTNTLVSACTIPTKCEYTCASGYQYQNTFGFPACVPVAATSTPPLSCSPLSQSIGKSLGARFEATGGNGTFSWSIAPSGANPASSCFGSTESPSIYWSGCNNPGTATITVRDSASHQASCNLTVTAPGALTCSPATQTVAENVGANFSATGGTGTYNWTAGGSPAGSPFAGTGSTFWTSYGQCGTKPITVTDSGGATASCSLTVTGASCGGGGGLKYKCGGSGCVRSSSGTFTLAECENFCPVPPPDGTVYVKVLSGNPNWTLEGGGTIKTKGSGTPLPPPNSSTYRYTLPYDTYTLTPTAGYTVDVTTQNLNGITDPITFNISETSALSCLSSKTDAKTGEVIDYTANGGSGTFSWSGGGSPATGGNTALFSTSFATPGSYLVRVTRGATTKDCPPVTVTNPPTVSVALSANPTGGMIDLISQITAKVTGTATGIINYKFWKDCQGNSCGAEDASYNVDATSQDTSFTYTAVKTYHPKVTVVREGVTASDNTTITTTPKKYACVDGSCAVSGNGAYASLASCADACVHSECTAVNACTSVKADPITGIGGSNRCARNSDCPTTPPPPGSSQKYSCKSGSCQPDATGQYTDSTCGGVCAPTYYSCSGGACGVDPNGQFTSANCNNSCQKVFGRCDAATRTCVNSNDPTGLDCSTDSACGCNPASDPKCISHLECVNSACVIASGAGANSSGCDSVGQYCGGVGKCSLKAAPPLISGGQSVKLTWQCVGAPKCSLTRQYKNSATEVTLEGSTTRTSGSYSEKPTGSATYTLKCTNSSASATADVKVSTLIECAPTDPTCKP